VRTTSNGATPGLVTPDRPKKKPGRADTLAGFENKKLEALIVSVFNGSDRHCVGRMGFKDTG
jgi:hypothetical protein